MISDGADLIIIEIKHTVNVMCLSHSQTIPLLVHGKLFHGKLSSRKSVPGAIKAGDRCSWSVDWTVPGDPVSLVL